MLSTQRPEPTDPANTTLSPGYRNHRPSPAGNRPSPVARKPPSDLQRRIAIANRVLLIACLLPFLYLLAGLVLGRLGANPVETLTNETGIWGLRLLWLTLMITPLRQLTGWQWLARLRRVPALTGFFYACLHVLTYLVFEQEFDPAGIWDDMIKRPYIVAGLACFLTLLPLAVTSTDAMMKWLGGKNWRNLHRFAYVAAVLAAAHYLLLVKRDITAPAIYILILAILFSLRLQKKSAHAKARPVQPSAEAIVSRLDLLK